MDQANPTAAETDTSAAVTSTETTQTTADTQQTQTAPTGTTAQDQTQQPQTAAPETYADFDVPENVIVDTELMGEFKSAAKDIGLTQEQAQHLASMGAKMAQKNEQTHKQNQKLMDEHFANQCFLDKEIGGEKLDENLAIANKAIEALGGDETRHFLKVTGVASYPPIVKAFIAYGKTLSEDRFMPSSAQVPGAQTSIAQKLYPNMNP